MNTPSHHRLRLFDLEKYREIQPIIEGISKRDTSVEVERVISMIKSAENIVRSDDFKKYNPDYIYEDYAEDLHDVLDILENNSLQIWFDKLDRHENEFNTVLEMCVTSICCPKYQWNTDDREPEQISGTCIDYTEFYYRCRENDLEILELLNFRENPTEMLPFNPDDRGIFTGIFNKQQLEKLARSSAEDIYSSSEFIGMYIEIYHDINFLLELANTRDNYTILNEESW